MEIDNIQYAITIINGTTAALEGRIEEKGEFAKIYCDTVREMLNQIKVELENAQKENERLKVVEQAYKALKTAL